MLIYDVYRLVVSIDLYLCFLYMYNSRVMDQRAQVNAAKLEVVMKKLKELKVEEDLLEEKVSEESKELYQCTLTQ